jgi:hypothetical protein
LISLEKHKIKYPELMSYFPLYVFSEEVSRVTSLGPEQSILTPTPRGQHPFFKDLPQSLLIHPRFPGFSSNVFSFPANLPFACSLMVLKFNLISNKMINKSEIFTEFSQKFTLLEFQTIDLGRNLKCKINAFVELTINEFGFFIGRITYSILVNDDNSKMTSITIEVKGPGNNYDPKTHVNRIGNNYDLNQRFINQGFYQVLSPQTLFFRVSQMNFK